MFDRKPTHSVASSSRSGGDVHELVHDWEIAGYDFIKGYQIDRFNSPTFQFYGFKWFIQLYPHGTSDNRENVAVFLIGDGLPKEEILCSHIQFAVINQKDATKTLRPRSYFYVLSGKDILHNHSNSGGHVNIIRSEELHDPSKGFIGTDGTLKIRLEFKISCLDADLCKKHDSCTKSRYTKVHDDSIAEQVGLVPSMRAMLNERMCTDVELRVPRRRSRWQPLPNNELSRLLLGKTTTTSSSRRHPSLKATNSSHGVRRQTASGTSAQALARAATNLTQWRKATNEQHQQPATSLLSPRNDRRHPRMPAMTTSSRRSHHRRSHRRRRRRNGAPSARETKSSGGSSGGDDVAPMNMSMSSDGFASPPRINNESASQVAVVDNSGSHSFTSSSHHHHTSSSSSSSPRLPSAESGSSSGDDDDEGDDHGSDSNSSSSSSSSSGRSGVSSLSSLDDSDDGSSHSSSSTHYVRRAHKCILASRSPVFRAMFSLRMQESVKNEVEIDDLSPQTLDALLNYIYSDTQPELHLVPGLLYAADKYQMPGLLHSCECVLVRALSVKNCLGIVHFADKHTMSCPHLRDSVMSFISERFAEVCKTPQFMQLMQEHTSLAHEIVCRVSQRSSSSQSSRS